MVTCRISGDCVQKFKSAFPWTQQFHFLGFICAQVCYSSQTLSPEKPEMRAGAISKSVEEQLNQMIREQSTMQLIKDE